MFVSSFAAVSYLNNNSYPSDESLANGSQISLLNNSILAINETIITNVKNKLHPNDYACIRTVYDSFGSFFIVIGATILFLNCFTNLYLYIIDYASDEEWYRHLFGQIILAFALISLDISEYYFVAKNFTFLNSDDNNIFTKEGVRECPKIFSYNLYVNLFVAIFISFLSCVQGAQTVKNYKILFYPENQDDMRAMSEDKDIVIMSKH
jgi:hypothetical protein